MGITLVGLPFLMRAVLGLDAKFYGGAESALIGLLTMGFFRKLGEKQGSAID